MESVASIRRMRSEAPKIQEDRELTDIIGLEFDGMEDAGLEIDRLNGRFVVVSKLIVVDQSLEWSGAFEVCRGE